MKYRKGDICRVVSKKCGVHHLFKIGDIIEIIHLKHCDFGYPLYFAKGQDGLYQAIGYSDIEGTTQSGPLHHLSLQIKLLISKLREWKLRMSAYLR